MQQIQRMRGKRCEQNKPPPKRRMIEITNYSGRKKNPCSIWKKNSRNSKLIVESGNETKSIFYLFKRNNLEQLL